MTDEERELLAAEHVLGTLETDRRPAFAEALEHDEALQALVAEWQARLAPLEQGQIAIEPPARVWEALQHSIDHATAEDAAGMVLVRAGERRWRRFAPGVRWLPLHRDQGARRQSFLLRLAPGARLPAHDHTAAEECLLLEGDLRIGDVCCAPGDYVLAAAGSDHPDIVSDGGAVVYISGDLGEAA